jgi:hypothetical protein
MKDPFKLLDSDFKDSVAKMSEAAIRDLIAKVSLDQVNLMKAKEEDLDLAQKREAASDAGAIYRDGSKMNKIRVLFLHQALEDGGKDVGEFDADEVAEENQGASERDQGLTS